MALCLGSMDCENAPTPNAVQAFFVYLRKFFPSNRTRIYRCPAGQSNGARQTVGRLGGGGGGGGHSTCLLYKKKMLMWTTSRTQTRLSCIWEKVCLTVSRPLRVINIQSQETELMWCCKQLGLCIAVALPPLLKGKDKKKRGQPRGWNIPRWGSSDHRNYSTVHFFFFSIF